MGEYIAQRVIDNIFNYNLVVNKRPDLKAAIDEYLIRKRREELIKE